MRVQFRYFWVMVLLCHAIGAAGWFALMPGGFPLGNPHFWANRVFPILIGAVAIAALATAKWGSVRWARAILLGLAMFWIGAAIASRIAFPVGFRWRFAAMLGVAGVVMIASYAPPVRRRLGVIPWFLIAPMAACGAICVLLQRAEVASTRPLNVPMPTIDGIGISNQSAFRLGADLRVSTSTGMVNLQHGRMMISIDPLLTFTSRAPDRGWTNFVPASLRIGPPRELKSIQIMPDRFLANYHEDGDSILDVLANEDGTARIDAICSLPEPIYSHLNSFCQIVVAGHKKLSLGFSPCAGARIEVMPSDYPIGRPERCAFLDDAGIFHVVEASTGEKGPYHELARGTLSRDDTLGISLFDDGALVGKISLVDWAKQCSTALSPTAGWGLPVNAIEFRLEGETPTSAATIFVTLAGTSVGRGWDSVGHSAGTYRNRVLVEFAGK